MDNKLKYIILIASILTVSMIAVYRAGVRKGIRESYPEETVRTDTVTQIDTVIIEKPKPVYITEVKETVDTLITQVTETDTVFVPISMPVISKTYADSTYKAVVSGIAIRDFPRLDTIEVYPRTMIVTETKILKDNRKWNWNLTIGAGYGYNISQRKFEPTIGVTIGYGFSFK